MAMDVMDMVVVEENAEEAQEDGSGGARAESTELVVSEGSRTVRRAEVFANTALGIMGIGVAALAVSLLVLMWGLA